MASDPRKDTRRLMAGLISHQIRYKSSIQLIKFPIVNKTSFCFNQQVLWVSGHHINIAQAEQILIRHFKGKNQDRTSSDPYCTNKVEKLNAGTCDSEADTRFVLYVQLKKLDQGKERQNFKFRCLIQLEFKIKQELRIHMHQQHDYDILTCRKCGVKFTREPDLRSHVKTHNSKVSVLNF